MRVIAGKYKRYNLISLEGNETRPSKDMLKEALFSSLSFEIEGIKFLDLFAGSGAVGIEAISRGASKVVFNDSNPKASNIIKKNLTNLGLKEEVYNLDCFEFINKVNECFDIIFLDPPYIFNDFNKLLKMLYENHRYHKDSIIIFESHKNTALDDEYGDLVKYKHKKYGISSLHYYRSKR